MYNSVKNQCTKWQEKRRQCECAGGCAVSAWACQLHANFEIRSADSTAQQAIASSDWPEIQTEQSTLKGDNNAGSAAADSKWRGGADRQGNSEIVTAVIII